MVSVVPALNDYGQEEEKFKGKYDYDIVKTTLLRKNFTNLTEKKESDFK